MPEDCLKLRRESHAATLVKREFRHLRQYALGLQGDLCVRFSETLESARQNSARATRFDAGMMLWSWRTVSVLVCPRFSKALVD